MREYRIVPEFRYYKYFPFFAILYQLIAIGFVVFGCFLSSAGFILALIFQACTLYFTGLLVCGKYYRINISANLLIVRNVLNKQKVYCTDTLRWKIHKIPWYNSYYIFIFSSPQTPIAIIKPHWKNALRIIHFPHSGKLSQAELEYISFLRQVGLLYKS